VTTGWDTTKTGAGTDTSKRTISIYDAISDDHAAQHSPSALGKPTRRRVREDRKRQRGRSKRWQAIHSPFAAATQLMLDAAKEIAWRPPKQAGLWTIDTGNTNCWGTGKRQLLRRSAADVTLLQETKLRQGKISQAAKQADRCGWRAVLSPAMATCKQGTSGRRLLSARGKGLALFPTTLPGTGLSTALQVRGLAASLKVGCTASQST